MKPKIAIVTRMAYNNPIDIAVEDDSQPQWRYPKTMRLRAFENLYLKSLKNQLYKDFDVYVFVGGVRGQQGCEYNTNLIKQIDASPLNIFYINRSEFDSNEYDIQIRMDSDDFAFPNFILKCVELYRMTSNENNLVVSFQPYIYDYHEKKLYDKRRRYKGIEASMFFAFFQREQKRKFICDLGNHRKVGNKVKVMHLDAGMCCLCVHGNNKSTSITSRDKYICDIEL